MLGSGKDEHVTTQGSFEETRGLLATFVFPPPDPSLEDCRCVSVGLTIRKAHRISLCQSAVPGSLTPPAPFSLENKEPGLKVWLTQYDEALGLTSSTTEDRHIISTLRRQRQRLKVFFNQIESWVSLGYMKLSWGVVRVTAGHNTTRPLI